MSIPESLFSVPVLIDKCPITTAMLAKVRELEGGPGFAVGLDPTELLDALTTVTTCRLAMDPVLCYRSQIVLYHVYKTVLERNVPTNPMRRMFTNVPAFDITHEVAVSMLQETVSLAKRSKLLRTQHAIMCSCSNSSKNALVLHDRQQKIYDLAVEAMERAVRLAYPQYYPDSGIDEYEKLGSVFGAVLVAAFFAQSEIVDIAGELLNVR